MRKIPTLFARNHDTDHLVRDEITPGTEWVVAGEGTATRKFDGTCVLVRDGKVFKRYDAKPGRLPPGDFEPVEDPDPVTGHRPGWVPADLTAPMERWLAEAIPTPLPLPGTFELIGPRINGNPEKVRTHCLARHGRFLLFDAPRTFDQLREYLSHADIEGIVWHHPDGRMVKIKKRDFGLKR